MRTSIIEEQYTPDPIVFDIAVQSNGHVLISGNFEHIGSMNVRYIAQLDPDGSLDPSFSSGLEVPDAISYEGVVYSMLKRPGGKLLIGGAFYVNTNVSSVNLVRLNPDGSVDASFQNPVRGTVRILASQSNGQVLVAGAFTSIRGVSRTNIARLNADGTLDNTFNTAISRNLGYDFNPPVSSLAVQDDKKILVAGKFTSVNGVARTNLARINPDGSLDESFKPVLGPITTANCITVQRDGKILVGCSYGYGVSNYTPCIRLNSNGSLDSSFHCTIANGRSQPAVYAIALDRQGKILVGGDFVNVNGKAVRGLARLNNDGTSDDGFVKPFAPLVNGYVFSLKSQDKDKILVGGNFTEVNGEPHRFLAKLRFDGTLDTNFTAAPDGQVTKIAIQKDGKILIAGSFTNVNGIPRCRIARLLSDGSLDDTFQDGLAGIGISGINTGNYGVSLYWDYGVEAMAIQDDARILIGGQFTSVNGVTCKNLARLNPDGTLDASFNFELGQDPNYNWIQAIALEQDGRILLGGRFQNGVARLLSNGSYDNTFNASFGSGYPGPPTIDCIGVRNDGKIIIGGAFKEIGSTSTQDALVQLLSDGSLDRGFPVSSAYAIYMLPDDSFFVGGWDFRQFNSNGDLVNNFSSRISGSFYGGDIEMDNNGKIVIAGTFTKVNGAPMPYLARLWANDHAPVLKNLSPAQPDAILNWHAISNRTYRVQYTEDLSANNWHDLPGDVCATNDLASKTDVTGSAKQRFYRVLELP